MEGSAGEAVCQGGERGGVMLPEFEDFAGEHSGKDSARRSEGGGGFMGFASCRRPQCSKTLAVVLRMLYRLGCRKGTFPMPKWNQKGSKNYKREPTRCQSEPRNVPRHSLGNRSGKGAKK